MQDTTYVKHTCKQRKGFNLERVKEKKEDEIKRGSNRKKEVR